MSNNEPYKSILSANGWRLALFLVCIVIFVFLISYIVRYTEDRNGNSTPSMPNASGNVKESPVSGSRMSEDANEKEEREFQLEMMRIQLLHDAFVSIMTTFMAVAISWIIASIAVVYSDAPIEVKQNFTFASVWMLVTFLIVCVVFLTVSFKYIPSQLDKLHRRFVETKSTERSKQESDGKEQKRIEK